MEQNFLLRSLELVIKVIQVHKVHKVHKVQMVCLVVMVHKGLLEQLEHKVLRDIRDYKVHRHI
jgi:hypothetical protein